MKVDVSKVNPALVSLYENPDQVVTLDANFLIPPDCHVLSIKDIPFSQCKILWLDPIFDVFSNLARSDGFPCTKLCLRPLIMISDHRES